MDANQINRLTKIVESRQWYNFDYNAHPEKKTFDAIADMLKGLPSDEIDLSLDLLEEYRIIKDYSNSVRDLIVRIDDITNGQKIFITPVVDAGAVRIKSGQSLLYDISVYSRLFKKNTPCFRDSPLSGDCQSHTGIHVSIDDFIGAGRQFMEMIDFMKKEKATSKITHIAVICIQAEAKNKLESEGFQVIALDVREKAIEAIARKTGTPIDSLYSRYDLLEQRSGSPVNFRRGSDQSEALITLKTTPNNTLPIFWIEGRIRWPAPFPRPRR